MKEVRPEAALPSRQCAPSHASPPSPEPPGHHQPATTAGHGGNRQAGSRWRTLIAGSVAVATALSFSAGSLASAAVVPNRLAASHGYPAWHSKWVRNAVAHVRSSHSGVQTTPGQPSAAPVGNNPQSVAVDEANGTVYVVNQNDNTLSVLNGSTCNATVTSGCKKSAPTVRVGVSPTGVIVNQATQTVYVTNGTSDTVSVINARTCNATHQAGCGHTPPPIAVGAGPVAPAVDQATDTVYVPNLGPNEDGSGDTVSVINGATCNASHHGGCGQTPPTVTVGGAPDSVDIDRATGTVYVANAGSNSVSVIDAATCSGTNHSGCGSTPPAVQVGATPFSVAVDQATDTVYTANNGAVINGDGTVSVIDGATCNATDHAGCGQHPHTVVAGSAPEEVSIDEGTNTVYVNNGGDGTVSLVNGATCDATHHSGCARIPPTVRVGFGPGWAAVDHANDTVYITNSTDNDVSMIDSATCNATSTSGCGRAAPTVTVGAAPVGVAVDQATDTVYTANNVDGTISVINAATCNATTASGCAQTVRTINVGAGPAGMAVDQATDTVYVANAGSSTVSVIDAATCNATHHAGCGQTPPTVKVAKGPAGVAVDPATDTVYVTIDGATGTSHDLSVINGATCNAHRHSGCGQIPATVNVGVNPGMPVVDQANGTVYVPSFADNTVSVVNAAICNGTDHAGCHQTPPVVPVGTNPFGAALDQATHTIYVGNSGGTTLSMINGATCNGTHHAGCNSAPPTASVQNAISTTAAAPFVIAVDQATDTVYTANLNGSFASGFDGGTVSVIDGARCNATAASGCRATPPDVPVGAFPDGMAIVEATHTVYVASGAHNFVSIFGFVLPRRPTGVAASIHAGTVQLSWHAPADGQLPVSYTVTAFPRCRSCRGRSTIGATFTTITGLKPGHAYTFTVKATNAAGTGRASGHSAPVTP
jgi:YVTN family beta-propeller protein